jgi:hypothetical protein
MACQYGRPPCRHGRSPARRLHRSARLALLVLLVLVSVPLAGAPAGASAAVAPPVPRAAAFGNIGIQLLDAPVTALQDPRARLYIVDHVHPGAVIRRRIEVSNTTAATLRVAIYAAAATIGNGQFVGGAGRTPDELSTWTSVRPAAPEVRAGGHATAIVTIAVPRDAAPGERYGVVWAETRSTPPAGGGITEVSRAGIRLYLSVGAGGPPAAEFIINSLRADRSPDGRPMVIATVHNSGGRALDVSGTLQLSAGPGGLRAGPFPANLGVTLAIGDTEPVTIILDSQLPAGPWNALVTLRSGLVVNSARATITFPDTVAPASPYPAIAGLVALLLACLGGACMMIRRGLTTRPAPVT